MQDAEFRTLTRPRFVTSAAILRPSHMPPLPCATRIPDGMGKWCLAVCGLMLFASVSARAQVLPDGPFVFGDGHVTLGGDVSWSVAREDTGFFNYTDYERSTLRMLHVAVLAAVKAGDHIEVLTEIRSENGAAPTPYGLYLRVRPW